ncbi:DUF2177 family protein [Candidatus Saccharibacteria bacterium]|nr:DUF2177 family protein [Candidatus Saccharibacteria bacterium]
MLTFIQGVYLYLLTAVAFFAIDIIWLGVVAKSFYNKQLGSFLASNINWVAAISFYLVYIFGIIYFAILPGLEKGSYKISLINGAILGLLAYATYDLSSLATLKNWPFTVVVVDIAWGIILTSLVALIGYGIASWLK